MKDQNKDLARLYNNDFYHNKTPESFSSALVVLKILFEIYQPNSIVDVGCGQGSWLAAAEELGSKRLVGYDGNWIKNEDLVSKNINFNSVNMESTFQINGVYDLAISVEVAEHLPEFRAKDFVYNLCNAAKVIVFSAAIKEQGGTNHINEQWQSYWIDIFKGNGFEVFDIFRSRIWNNSDVNWWYRQNIFLFIDTKHETYLDFLELNQNTNNIFDIVHPQLYNYKMEETREMSVRETVLKEKLKENPTLIFCLKSFAKYFLNLVKTANSKLTKSK